MKLSPSIHITPQGIIFHLIYQELLYKPKQINLSFFQFSTPTERHIMLYFAFHVSHLILELGGDFSTEFSKHSTTLWRSGSGMYGWGVPSEWTHCQSSSEVHQRKCFKFVFQTRPLPQPSVFLCLYFLIPYFILYRTKMSSQSVVCNLLYDALSSSSLKGNEIWYFEEVSQNTI